MSDSNPLIPQGSLLEEQAKSRPHLRIALCIVAVHLVFLGGLLMQGCKRDDAEDTTKLVLPPRPAETNYPGLPRFDSGSQPFEQPRLITNPPPAEVTLADEDVLPPGDEPLGIGNNLLPLPPSDEGRETLPMDISEPSTLSTPIAGQSPTVAEPLAVVKEHKVQRGEYFITIAKRYGVSAADVAKANPGVDSTRLQVGQILKIPAATAGRAGTVTEKPAVGGAATYVVKKGDNLHRIATRYGITVDELKRMNSLVTDRIIINQKLEVPATGGN